MTDRRDEAENGLYVTSAPGEAGNLILAGNYYPATPRQQQPLTWAANNTILISRSPEEGIMLVELGEG